MSPAQIKVEDKKYLYIKWDDDTESRIKLANIRNSCPCAVCTTERNQRSSTYVPIFTSDELTIKNIRVIGNYAIGIEWKDNHNTGIFEFNFIKKLS